MAGRTTREFVRDFQDLIGPSSRWPNAIKTTFWKKHWKYPDRFKMVCFFEVNGVPPALVHQWVNFRQVLKDKSAERHIRSLYKAIEAGPPEHWRGYNVARGETFTLRQLNWRLVRPGQPYDRRGKDYYKQDVV